MNQSGIRMRGFTLLEMVVAIGIFAVIAAIAYGSMNQFLKTRDAMQQRYAATRKLQIAMNLLEHDVRYMNPRPVRNGNGETRNAFMAGGNDVDFNERAAGELMRLTTAQPDPLGAGLSRLERVAWRLKDGKLRRVRWDVLDRDIDSVEHDRAVLDQVSDVRVTAYRWSDADRFEPVTEWTSPSPDVLPVAVEIVITLDDDNQVRRLLEVANGS